MKFNNNVKISLTLGLIFFLTSCSFEHPKDQKNKQENACGYFIKRKSSDPNPYPEKIQIRKRDTYPWEDHL